LTGRAKSTYLASAGGNARNDNDGSNGMRTSNGIFRANRMSKPPDSPSRISDVTDGLTNTILLGEAEYLLDSKQGCSICDRFLFYHMNADSGNGSDFSEALGSTYYRINTKAKNNDERECAFASHHPGGANFALGDGSVRFVSENVNLTTVWRPLGSKSGGETIGDY
jgi:prepilin-type processing-associated H-X9-DG protein